MEVRRYESRLLLSNMYLIVEGNEAIVIDPSENTAVAQGLTVDKILLTHEHYDHISGVNAWKAATNAQVLCSDKCAENIQNPRKNLSRVFEVFCELQTWIAIDHIPDSDQNYACFADETFANETRFEWKGHSFHLFEMPGHSPGSIGILLDDRYFFSGDSLMENHQVELRFPGGSKADWQRVSQSRLAALPDGIRVYPGHFHDFTYHMKKGAM